ncbi:hypothetical protein ADIS_4074 [Lunatimonas lonarensis]|uniref:Secretion system C-terminal sorting domain-containing protein n=2 Tax=Lunatimonas lonarensis TaxID=1232681 RepID=R7ZMP2_9BACT|nr:T9SS type A sorting domain-containing protein [Lunatimonas lonarensis]EON75370.1 hypothetical protein ADIS_4074 [Lunatimonas lonarensis]
MFFKKPFRIERLTFWFGSTLKGFSIRFFYIFLISGAFLLSGSTKLSGQAFGGASGIITDYNGFWNSSINAINPIMPDNTHHLLAFSWNGQVFSTGVDDENLAANSVNFSPQIYQAFPVRNIQSTNVTYIGLGQLYDGIDNGISSPPPFSIPPNLSSFLTRGLQGLDFGSGVANIAAGSIIFDFTGIIDETQIGDGIPDILVTQMADPNGNLDAIFMTDADGNMIGNALSINHLTIPSLGKWSADFYRLNGTSAAFIKGTRDLRLWVAELSAFGITLDNYHLVRSMRYTLNGSSDPAFAAFKVGVFDIIAANDDHAETLPKLPVQINVLANDLPQEILNPAFLRIISSAANGATQINNQTGVITYTPNDGFSGLDFFIYEICGSSELQCDEATVFIDVAAGALSSEFIHFNATWLPKGEVSLSWKLRSSPERRRTIVERSSDGGNWISIHEDPQKVPSLQADLSYIDPFPNPTKPTFYRICVVTEPDRRIYSEVRRVAPPINRPIILEVYPNPTAGFVTVTGTHSSMSDFAIISGQGFDVSGQVIVHPKNSLSFELDLSTLSPGIYILKVGTNVKRIKKN